MIFNTRSINVIHAQGLNAGIIGIALKVIFRTRTWGMVFEGNLAYSVLVDYNANYLFEKVSAVGKSLEQILGAGAIWTRDPVLILFRGGWSAIYCYWTFAFGKKKWSMR